MFDELNIMWKSVGLSLAAIFLILAGYFLRYFFAGKKIREAEAKAKELTEFARREAENRKKEGELAAKDMMIKLRQDFERETKERRDETAAVEKRILQKEENLERRADLLEKKEKDITTRVNALHQDEENIKKKKDDLDKLIGEEKQRLQTISSL